MPSPTLSIETFRHFQREFGFSDDALLPQEFVVRLDLPENLRGIGYILQVLELLRSEVGSEFESFFRLSAEAEYALRDTVLRLSDTHPQFYNRHKQNGWCDAQPVYALCFELAASARIKRSTEKIRLVKLFLQHYWNNEDRIDAEFTTTSSTPSCQKTKAHADGSLGSSVFNRGATWQDGVGKPLN